MSRSDRPSHRRGEPRPDPRPDPRTDPRTDPRDEPPGPPGGHPLPPARPTPFQREVAAVVEGLRPGDVLTYAEVALEAGHPGAAQAVANVLRRVPGLPWWRVVPTSGRLYRTHAPTQRPLLEADGVTVDDDGRVLGGGASGRSSAR